ncbi:phosphatidylserine decarboxylase family protein [Metarhizium album ARSEF 1941]|uniref:Phosphatidylserine decarboxylase family protein n=1 Tax=Metarhizium album (strain ARSEF 1941) TaxID=1081103 RepID=A0A0B2X1N5_METAS|nr:phosphatidylserine decarboxylase family protein [Metarhizium album ARSEF 1941]KHN99592.1 phosphatidylserine decarboxylase family protein [Metarhizium album ARSEF 1941]
MTVFPSPSPQSQWSRDSNRLPGAPCKSAQWLQNFIKAVDSRRDDDSLHPVVQDLKDLVESRPSLRMWASAMFDEIPNKVPYNEAPVDGNLVRGHRHMLKLFSVIVVEVAPTWNMANGGHGLVGLPFQAILDWPMGTPSGHAFFLSQDVNERMKVILDTWRDGVLKTSKSQYVVTTDDGGWLGNEALMAIEKDANLDSEQWHTFQELFECDPEKDPIHWGFGSWDMFFVRKFKDIDKLRPIAYPDHPEWVVNACESRPIMVRSGIREYDRFWLKGQNYSVREMLNHNVLAADFVGGTAYQALLMLTSYHRWASPVSGHVVHAEIVSGTYFSERQANGLFSSPVGPPEYNQVYMSHVATRAIIYIKAPDPVGLMCLIAIGTADVSTCEISSKFAAAWPQPVKKGEEIGMFHYGGSSLCLLFRRGVRLAWVESAIPGNSGRNLAVRSALAVAYYAA